MFERATHPDYHKDCSVDGLEDTIEDIQEEIDELKEMGVMLSLGEEYLNNFILQTEKTRDLNSTRGQIMDVNGEVLAYNELAYSVKIEDVFESGRKKNSELNEVVYRLIQMIEKHNDSVITDFKIYIDEDGEFAYSVEGTSLLRFQA